MREYVLTLALLAWQDGAGQHRANLAFSNDSVRQPVAVTHFREIRRRSYSS